MIAKLVSLTLAGGLMAAVSSVQAQPTDANARFRALAAQYFSDAYFRYAPTLGTSAGLHQYDAELENYSRAGIDAQIATLHQFEAKLDAFPDAGRDESTEGDLAMVRDNIKGTLLTLETIRPWEKNPDTYSSGITNSAFVLMERNFAPPDERLRSLIARERQMPAVFEAARRNLSNPPQIYTEIALEQLPGIISFFRNDVPEAFKDAKDQAEITQFHQTNAQVIAALQ